MNNGTILYVKWYVKLCYVKLCCVMPVSIILEFPYILGESKNKRTNFQCFVGKMKLYHLKYKNSLNYIYPRWSTFCGYIFYMCYNSIYPWHCTPTPPIIFFVSVHFLVPICVFPQILMGDVGEGSSRPSVIFWNLIFFLHSSLLRIFEKSHSFAYPCTFIFGLAHYIIIY